MQWPLRDDHGMENWQRIALGCGGAMFVAMGLGRFSYGAMIPALVQSGQVSIDQAGWVGGINLAGFFVGAFISEALRRVWPMARVLRGAVMLSLVALFASALAWGFIWLGFWRGILGITAGLIMVQGLALTMSSAPETRRPVAAGLMFSGVGVGIFFSGVLVPMLLTYGVVWAWVGIAGVGIMGASSVLWGWRTVGEAKTSGAPLTFGVGDILRRGWAWQGLAVAYFLFSFGLTSHTLYWVDFLVRDQGLDISSGGAHWAIVGLFAVIGPWAAAWLARRTHTAWAVTLAFIVLGVGIAGPGLATWVPILWLSSMIFGAQPGVSTVKAARARDLGTHEAMPAIMRVMIMSSALGGAVGGVVIPALFAATGRYDLMFLVAGGAMGIAALCTLPGRANAG
jgi:predicted MFS family arabinose efflux permease